MNLNKHIDFFNPMDVEHSIHIVGVGAMGSRIAEMLARLGQPKIHIWDFDTVESVNITNQLYTHKHIGQTKEDALESILKDINPNIEIIKHGKWDDKILTGYVFLCVDSIELRQTIVKKHMENKAVKAMFDTRMRLEDAQSYAANWKDKDQREAFLNSMEFTSEEATEATPVSACGTTLSVAPTVITTAAFTVSNFMNLIKTNELKTMIFTNAFKHTVVTY